jgi:high-affinity Fe2+/Pb2+ permease
VTTAEKYVAAAYAAFVLALLVYVGIISLKLARFERELAELVELVRRRDG